MLLSEKGLYKVLMMTRKPAGDRMRDWLVAEVLPQIVRDGRSHWIARHVGGALGYAKDGSKLTTKIGGDWKKSFKDCAITSTLRVDLEASCLWYSHEFKNTSEQTLSGLDTQTCFHLVNAPEFISIHGERIWACLDGVWTTTDKVPRCESPDPRRVSFLGKGIRSERTVIPYNNFLSATMPEQACHPLIVAERFGASGSVGIACRNFRSLFNNNDCILRCIHSEPFPVDGLPPGESAEQQGVILFSEGDHTRMVEDFERLTGSVWDK